MRGYVSNLKKEKEKKKLFFSVDDSELIAKRTTVCIEPFFCVCDMYSVRVQGSPLVTWTILVKIGFSTQVKNTLIDW